MGLKETFQAFYVGDRFVCSKIFEFLLYCGHYSELAPYLSSVASPLHCAQRLQHYLLARVCFRLG